jgi:hypothetical protein
MTGQALINLALSTLGAIQSGDSGSTEELADGLVHLNLLIGSLNAEGLTIPSVTRTQVALDGSASYTLGTRPMKIKAAAVVQTGTFNFPLEIATPARWAATMDRSTEADYADLLFYQFGHAAATGTLYLAPPPAADAVLELISKKAVPGGVMVVQETLTLTGATSYTIGVGGSLDTERPLEVLAASVQESGTVSRSPDIVTAEGWAVFPNKGNAGAFAKVLFYDAAVSSPKVYLAPKPASGTLELDTLNPLSTLASLSESITLPDGYEEALHFLLAHRLAPSFGVKGEPLQDIIQLATNAKLSIQGLNRNVLGDLLPANPAPGAAAPPVEEKPPA